ncbi:hypothetical protein DPMN_111838 [Dreissena polymorpha]|uniref:Uncharacterized protein n=1 Tax=Dreissena polymorpha TaxID=45954 RepID=A0A9D4KFE4_DREPO|nr:hypothetical protein DPMN_111838 [Dreissena polymorpha]
MIDEAELPGKGAGCVVSVVHYYFKHYGYGEEERTGLHESTSISINTMLAGHTKFAPDWHFGVWFVK